MLPYVLVGIALGIATETLAHAGHLWVYRSPWLRVANVMLVFGVVFGGLAYALGNWVMLFVAGALIGVIYEVANDRALKAWTFPGDRVPWLRGQTAVVGVGISWGFVPIFIRVLRGAFT